MRAANKQEIAAILEEVERRWKSRTPATRIDEMLPSYRVSRSEIRAIASDFGVSVDGTDEDFNRELFRLMGKLRREFPSEKWEPLSEVQRDLWRRLEVPIPRSRRREGSTE